MRKVQAVEKLLMVSEEEVFIVQAKILTLVEGGTKWEEEQVAADAW